MFSVNTIYLNENCKNIHRKKVIIGLPGITKNKKKLTVFLKMPYKLFRISNKYMFQQSIVLSYHFYHLKVLMTTVDGFGSFRYEPDHSLLFVCMRPRSIPALITKELIGYMLLECTFNTKASVCNILSYT